MPYTVGKDTSVCPVSKPFAVKKAADGSVVPGGCHATHEKALAHQRALTIATQKEQKAVIEGLVEQSKSQ